MTKVILIGSMISRDLNIPLSLLQSKLYNRPCALAYEGGNTANSANPDKASVLVIQTHGHILSFHLLSSRLLTWISVFKRVIPGQILFHLLLQPWKAGVILQGHVQGHEDMIMTTTAMANAI